MIFRTALGQDFDRLHPMLRRRFAFESSCVGTGVMDNVWHGKRYMAPFLRFGTLRNILFPETGSDVPFTIENYRYQDTFGRDTVTFVRTFDLRRALRRRFDATMVYSGRRGAIVDYLGTHQHIAVDLWPRVDDDGGLRIRSGAQRLFGVPLPTWLTGHAEVREWFDDETGRFRIEVAVSHPRLGPIFGYHGSFTATFVDGPVPAAVKPYRERARE